MKKNGFTLTEVIVSLVIIGMVITLLTVIFANHFQIEQKNLARTNAFKQVEHVMAEFTVDPIDFENEVIYFDSSYLVKSGAETGYYLTINYTVDTDISPNVTLYNLEVVIHNRDSVWSYNGHSSFLRTIARAK